jgi:GMP synthase PP-ATPase subunit
MSDDDLDNLLEDDPETLYHSPEDIKSVEAMKIDKQMISLFIKKGWIDEEEAELKNQALDSMLELAVQSQQDKDSYIENLKDSWDNHQDLKNQ